MDLLYASTPDDYRHILKLYFIDSIGVKRGNMGEFPDIDGWQILWRCEGQCCLHDTQVGCCPSYDCCRYRTLTLDTPPVPGQLPPGP